MSDAAEILVIIISIFLALFLLLATVLIIFLIKVTRQIKSVTATAKSAAEHISSTAYNISKVTSPALITKVVLEQIKKFKKS